MITKITNQEITIGIELDSWLGYDPSTIEYVDIEESQDTYEIAIRKEINKVYPELKISFVWDGQSDYEFLEFESTDYEDFQEFLDYVTDKVYNNQDFWVYNNKGNKK